MTGWMLAHVAGSNPIRSATCSVDPMTGWMLAHFACARAGGGHKCHVCGGVQCESFKHLPCVEYESFLPYTARY